MRSSQRSPFDELDGYVDLGMKGEVQRHARKLLSSARLSHSEFQRVLLAVLTVSDSLKQWRAAVDRCYSRLSLTDQRKVHPMMLSFYCSLGNYKKAKPFLPSKPSSTQEMFFALNVLLKLGQLTKAKSVARLCEKALKTDSDFERNALHDALADYYARVGDWQKAIDHWIEMKVYEPLGTNGLVAMVEIETAFAIETARKYLTTLEEYRKHRRGDTDIKLPKNELRIIEDAKKKLTGWLSHLEQVVPKNRQAEFGM